MEIKLKNYEIISAINSMQEIMSVKLPSKVSWNLSKNFKKLSEAIKDFNDFQYELLKQYAIKNQNGEVEFDENQQFKIIPEYVSNFNKERNDLLNFEDTLTIHIIKLSDLENIEVSTTALYGLDFMIDDDTE